MKREKKGKLGPATGDGKVVAYRLIGGLGGKRLCYIIIEAKRELFGIGIQEAFGNVRHWDGNQPVRFERLIVAGPEEEVRIRARRTLKVQQYRAAHRPRTLLRVYMYAL